MATLDPPVSIREKGERVVLVFGISNVKQSSIKLIYELNGEEACTALRVCFDAVSPARKYEKTIMLPKPIVQHRTTTEVQSKNMTVQVVKVDASIEWGTTWLKVHKKASAKVAAKSKAEAPTPVAHPESVRESVDEEVTQEEGAEIGLARPDTTDDAEALLQSAADSATVGEVVEDAARTSAANDTAVCEDAGSTGAPAANSTPAGEDAWNAADASAADCKAIGEDGVDAAKPESVEDAQDEQCENKEAKPRSKGVRVQARGNARDRLRKRLEDKGVAITSTGPPEKENCPLAPPTDPNLLIMLQEANRDWPQDRKKATMLYRLTAKKGYVPALVLLVNQGVCIKDDPLVIDTIFELLLHPAAVKQIPVDLLSTYSNQLAMMLRLPTHDEVARRRQPDLDALTVTYPILKSVANAREAQDALAAIRTMQEKVATSPTNSGLAPPAPPPSEVEQAQDLVKRFRDASAKATGDVAALFKSDDKHADLVSRVKEACVKADIEPPKFDEALLSNVKQACNPSKTEDNCDAIKAEACAKNRELASLVQQALDGDGLVSRVKEACHSDKRPSPAEDNPDAMKAEASAKNDELASRVKQAFKPNGDGLISRVKEACNSDKRPPPAEDNPDAMKAEACAKNEELASIVKQALKPNGDGLASPVQGTCELQKRFALAEGKSAPQADVDSIRKELQGLKLSALARKARECNVEETLLFDALDDGPAAVIDLIVQKIGQQESGYRDASRSTPFIEELPDK